MNLNNWKPCNVLWNNLKDKENLAHTKEMWKLYPMQQSNKLNKMHALSCFKFWQSFSVEYATHINEEIVVNCHTSRAIVVNHARSWFAGD